MGFPERVQQLLVEEESPGKAPTVSQRKEKVLHNLCRVLLSLDHGTGPSVSAAGGGSNRQGARSPTDAV